VLGLGLIGVLVTLSS